MYISGTRRTISVAETIWFQNIWPPAIVNFMEDSQIFLHKIHCNYEKKVKTAMVINSTTINKTNYKHLSTWTSNEMKTSWEHISEMSSTMVVKWNNWFQNLKSNFGKYPGKLSDLFSSPCQRQCELLPSLGVRRLSFVNFSHFNFLLSNPLAKWTETW